MSTVSRVACWTAHQYTPLCEKLHQPSLRQLATGRTQRRHRRRSSPVFSMSFQDDLLVLTLVASASLYCRYQAPPTDHVHALSHRFDRSSSSSGRVCRTGGDCQRSSHAPPRRRRLAKRALFVSAVDDEANRSTASVPTPSSSAKTASGARSCACRAPPSRSTSPCSSTTAQACQRRHHVLRESGLSKFVAKMAPGNQHRGDRARRSARRSSSTTPTTPSGCSTPSDACSR